MHDRNDIFLINWRAVASLSPNHRAVCVFSMYYHRKSAHIFCNSISCDKADFRVITWITRWNYWNLNIYRWWHGIGRWCFCVECSYSIIKSKNDFPTKRLIDPADAKKKTDTKILIRTIIWLSIDVRQSSHVLALDLFFWMNQCWTSSMLNRKQI